MKVVLYHTNCNDGLFAAYVAWLKFGSEAVYIPVNYKPIQDMEPQEALDFIFNPEKGLRIDDIGNSKYRVSDITKEKYKDIELYVVDYSFPVAHHKEHRKLFKQVLVIDHHDTAIKDYCEHYAAQKNIVEGHERIVVNFSDQNKIIFGTDESGALLTYKYFFPEKEVPAYLKLISDRDLFTFKLKYSRVFHSGIKALNINNFNKLHQVVTYGIDRILDIGSVFQEYKVKKIQQIKNINSVPITINLNGVNYPAIIVNSDLEIASDLCASIYSNEYPIAIAYTINKYKKVSWSVRSIKEVNSSLISKSFGGGGHKNSSGFTTNFDVLNKILSTELLEVTYDDSNSITL